MTDRKKLVEIQIHGIEAAKLLENDTLQKALGDLERDYLDQIRESEVRDKDKRENAFLMLKAVQGFRDRLSLYVAKGTNATRELGKDKNV